MLLGMGPFELLLLIGSLTVPAAVIYLGYRFVRAQERRAASAAELAALAGRMGDVEQQMAAMGATLEQVAEGQRFTTAVLAEPSTRPPG